MRECEKAATTTPPPKKKHPRKSTILNRMVREDLTELVMLVECMNHVESEGRVSQLEGLFSAKA